MTESILLEASLFQLHSALANVEDPMFKMQLKLTMDLLANAVNAVGESPSPATVNDVEFALNDVAAVVSELSAADAEFAIPALEMMQADVATLKESTTLPKMMIEAVRAFQASLRERRSAVERQTYREGGSTEPLPYPPAQLAAEATMLRPYLAKAGFATPALDDLIADPDSLRFHSMGEILDELDVIIGG